MQRLVRTLVPGLLLVVGGCATAPEPFEPPPPLPGRRTVIVPPDVECIAVGFMYSSEEPRADWTERARCDAVAALERGLRARRHEVVPWPEHGLDARQREAIERFRKLAGAVGRSLYLFFDLPTKQGDPNWSLGETGRPLAEATGAELALHLWAVDRQPSEWAGRIEGVLSAAASVISGRAFGMYEGEIDALVVLIDLHSGVVLRSTHLHDYRSYFGRGDFGVTLLMEKLLAEWPE